MLSREIEIDGAYLGQSGNGLRSKGTDEASFIAAAERACGKLAISATLDCSGKSYREFADWHVSKRAHVRADGWNGCKGGMKKWPGLDQKAFNVDNADASFPLVHLIISNFKAHVVDTYREVVKDRLQAYADSAGATTTGERRRSSSCY